MRVQIVASHDMDNAPPGYLIARIAVASGLYAESERNPFTDGEWRWISFRLGDIDAPGNESEGLCSVRAEDATGVAEEVRSILLEVSKLFEAPATPIDRLCTCGRRSLHSTGWCRTPCGTDKMMSAVAEHLNKSH